MNTLKKIKVLGITNDFNKCDCCGKENLSKTVAILDIEMGVVMHFGTTCAAMADKYDTLEAAAEAKKEIKKVVYTHSQRMKDALRFAFSTLSKIYGTIPVKEGNQVIGAKLNCGKEILNDCQSKVIAHWMNPETKRTPFIYSV